MDPVREVLLGAGVPAAVSAAGLAALHLRRRDRQALDTHGGPLVFAAATLAGMTAVVGLPSVPPVGVADALPWVVLAAGLAGFAEGKWFARGGAGWWRLGVAAAVAAFLLRAHWSRALDSAASASPSVMSLTVMTLTTAAALAAMASFAEGSRAFWSPAAGAFLWMLTFSAASVVLLQTGNAMLAQFMGSLAAATGPAWILALWRRAPVLGGNAMPALVLTGGAILVSGHFYGELGLGELAIVAAAPLTSVAAASLASGLGRPVWTHLAGLTGAALPLAAAVWLTRSETPYP